jgi:hypothetical protein
MTGAALLAAGLAILLLAAAPRLPTLWTPPILLASVAMMAGGVALIAE